MKRKWENHELIEHWTLEAEDREVIFRKKGANRLGFALLLKFFPPVQFTLPHEAPT